LQVSIKAGKAAVALALFLAGTRQAQAQVDEPPAQSFSALEAAGVRIGTIRVRAEDVFDTGDPREDKWLFRLANKLHIQTRADVVAHALLFQEGELVSVRLIEETERLLRSNRYLYDVKLRPLEVRDGIVDIEVVTRDTWSLDLGASAGRAGGASSSGLQLAEYNLLGTGTTVTLGRSKNIDRTSTPLGFRNNRAFGTWTDLSFSHAVNSDGRRDSIAAVRPFYALDTRWAAGLTASRDDRIDSVYQGGNIISQYRQRQNLGEAFVGWSTGLVDGWVNRYTLGLSVQDSTYVPEPGLLAPSVLQSDRQLRAPFVRWDLIQDRFDRQLNRNLIGRPEFFSLGLASTVQMGYATRTLGSSQNALLYAASLSHGFEATSGHTLIAAAKLSGEYLSLIHI
jgi:hypothetical protein